MLLPPFLSHARCVAPFLLVCLSFCVWQKKNQLVCNREYKEGTHTRLDHLSLRVQSKTKRERRRGQRGDKTKTKIASVAAAAFSCFEKKFKKQQPLTSRTCRALPGRFHPIAWWKTILVQPNYRDATTFALRTAFIESVFGEMLNLWHTRLIGRNDSDVVHEYLRLPYCEFTTNYESEESLWWCWTESNPRTMECPRSKQQYWTRTSRSKLDQHSGTHSSDSLYQDLQSSCLYLDSNIPV